MAPYQSEGMKNELPGRRPNDGCNDGGQQRDNQMFELLVDRKSSPALLEVEVEKSHGIPLGTAPFSTTAQEGAFQGGAPSRYKVLRCIGPVDTALQLQAAREPSICFGAGLELEPEPI